MSLDILKSKIKNKEFSGLFYLYGEEEYLKDYYYQSIRKKSVSEMREFNVYEFEGKNLSLNSLENIINSFESNFKRVTLNKKELIEVVRTDVYTNNYMYANRFFRYSFTKLLAY